MSSDKASHHRHFGLRFQVPTVEELQGKCTFQHLPGVFLVNPLILEVSHPPQTVEQAVGRIVFAAIASW